MNERVILIGLDGGEPSQLRALLDDAPARHPHLRRLLDDGVWGTLRSTRPPLSPPAWATLMTGMNPGKHGVFDFFHMPFAAQGSYVRRLITSAQWRAPGLWDHCAAGGRTAAFVNMPMCYPPPRVDGVTFVCGLGTPPGAETFTHPADLSATLAGVELEPGDGTTMDRGEFLQRCRRVGASMLTAAERLWHAGQYDLFCVALTFPDRFQHAFWDDLVAGEPAVTAVWREWFAAFDAFLGRVLGAATLTGGTVLLFSDHGFGAVRRYFHVNRWLLQRGWLHVGDPSRLGTPDGLLSAIDWSRTRAYCLTEYGDVRLNVRGREPHGIVHPDGEARMLAAQLGAELQALRDPDGKPVVDDVTPGTAVHRGPFASDGGDLLVTLQGFSVLCRIDGRGNDLREPDGPLFVDADRPDLYRGAHRANGLIAGMGLGVRRPAEPLVADVQDLAPTVLHLLDLPLHPDMDGRVVDEMLAAVHAQRAPRIAAAPPVAATAAPVGYDADEEARITEQLRQLGYVE